MAQKQVGSPGLCYHTVPSKSLCGSIKQDAWRSCRASRLGAGLRTHFFRTRAGGRFMDHTAPFPPSVPWSQLVDSLGRKKILASGLGGMGWPAERFYTLTIF